MTEAFRGEFTQKVDNKARVSIPAAFRRVLEAGDPDSPRPRIVMVYGDERRQYVECYTVAEMAQLERRIRKLPLGSPQRRLLERNLITLSLTAEVDEDGRIVLAPKLRDKMGLDGDALSAGAEAVFAGMLDTFQIWKRDRYEAELTRAAEAEAALLDGDVDILSLLGDEAEG
ncbi:MAG: transcriptional regulator MraZ [Rhodobacteraceae bacterium]|nr:transcriptional regulator MraZ [Paracoccaceae bacterium]